MSVPPGLRWALVLAVLEGTLSSPLHSQQNVPIPPGIPVPQTPVVSPIPAAQAPATPQTEATPPTAAAAATGSSQVRMSGYGLVDVLVQNDTVGNVLYKLAEVSGRSINPGRSGAVVVTANLTGLPFADALDGLLRPYGLGWVQRGEVIELYTTQELDALGLVKVNLISKTIPLDYVRAEEANQFSSHLLSRDGYMDFTKDMEAEAVDVQAGEVAGQSVGGSTEIYTPDKDEFALKNEVIVHDHPENVAVIEAFLKDLDVRPPQVLIEATILQTGLTEETAFGVDFALLSDVQFTDFFSFPGSVNPIDFFSPDKASTPASGPATQPDNQGRFVISNPGNTGQGQGTLKIGITSDDVGVFIRALDRVSDVTLLSNPKVLVMNRQRSRILVGQKVSYILTTVVDQTVLQSLEFIDTGIVLDLRPFVMRDGQVRLELSPKVSEVTMRDTIVDGVTTQIPDETLRTITTSVLVPQGYTAVLGGLFREDTDRKRSQVPFLGDIPLLGWAFRGTDSSVKQEEIIFLIRAVVMQPETLEQQGRRGEEFAEAVRVGSRLGLLPWSRERRSSRLNMKAESLAREGQMEDALFYLSRSLELNPVQPEAVRLRQQMMTEAAWWPTRSVLERIIDGELDAGFRQHPVTPPDND